MDVLDAVRIDPFLFFFSSRRRHTRCSRDWSSDVCSSDLSPGSGPGHSLQVGANVDVSNECGPQSETFITVNPARPKILAGGSNEIFRLPMRGYFSSDGGASWGGADLPLPPAIGGPHRFGFGSGPSR